MKKHVVIAASVGLALALGACGGSSGSGKSAEVAQDQPVEEQVVEEQVAEEQPVEEQAPSEQIIFDGDTMRVVFKDVREEPSISGVCYIYLEVENKTGTTVWFHPAIEKASANGYNVMYASGLPTYVDAGNKAIMSLFLTYQQFDAQSFDDVHSIKFDLVQDDKATFDEIARTAVDIEL